MLKSEEEQSQYHGKQAGYGHAGRGGNGASQGEKKTVKSDPEHDEVPGTTFRVSRICVHSTARFLRISVVDRALLSV